MSGDDIRLEVTSNPKFLCVVRALVRAYVSTAGVDPDRVEEVVLAVDEACANSIRHAYGGRPDGRLELELRGDQSILEIVLKDRGKPAPRDRVGPKPAETPRDPDRLQPGGLGVPIIHRVFDEVHFEPGPEAGNCVTMRLRHRTDGEGTA